MNSSRGEKFRMDFFFFAPLYYPDNLWRFRNADVADLSEKD